MQAQRNTADQAKQAFAEASSIYETRNQEYETRRRIFLNEQAGLIAREQLRPGKTVVLSAVLWSILIPVR